MEKKFIGFKLLYFLIISLIILTYIMIDYKTYYDSSCVKYSLMIVVCVYIFFIGLKNIIKKNDIKIYLLYLSAITFTLISDYFLLILDDYYHLALTTFILAHLSYATLIYFSSSLMNKKWLIIEKSLILLVGIIVLIITRDLLDMLIVIYALCLINNFIDCIILLVKTKEKYALMLVIGFLLFMGCDICVLLSNLEMFMDVTSNIIKIERSAECIVWIFYGPSQVFLSLSTNRGKKNEKESIES